MFNLNIFGREDLTPIRKLLIMHAIAGGTPLNEYEIEGNPVAFNTNVAKPLSAFTIPFLPVQAGDGDPSPQNPRPISGRSGVTAYRTGANVWDEETELGGINSSTGQEYPATGAIRAKNYIPVVPGVSYYIKAPSMTGFTGCWYDKDKNYISTTYQVNSAKAAPNNAYFFRFGLPSSYGTTYGNDISFNYPSTDTEYHAYTGQSYPVTFPALEKNLLPGMETGAINQSTGQDETDDTVMRCVGYIPVEPGQTYTLGTLASSGNIRFFGYDDDKNYLGDSVVRNVTNAMYTVGSGTYFIRFHGATERFTGVDVQFEKGDLHTAYEPFMNTVYGGTLDAVTGVLTITHKVIDVSSLSWNRDGDTRRYRLRLSNYSNTPTMEIISNALVPTLESLGTRPDYSIRMYANNYYQVEVAMPDTFDITSFKAFIKDVDGNGTHLQIVFKYNNPPVYQLAPLSIQTIVGDNTIWSDTYGENTVKFKKKG